MSLSEIRVNTTKTRTGVGTITYTETGPVITGIATASNFKTGSTNIHSTGVEVANINTSGSTATFGGAISGTTASFSGTVSIGGTLTYEDVTNIDSVGILTARSGVRVPDGGRESNEAHIRIGDDGDFRMYHEDGAHTTLENHSSSSDLILMTSSAARDIILKTNGNNERLRITSAGKVGINSTSPTYALEVDGGTQNTVIAVRSSDAKAAISFLDNTSGGYGRATIGGEGDQVYITSGNGVEKIRFGTGGSGNTIGISTTLNMVTNSEVLAVRGYSTFKSTSQAYAALYVGNEGSTTDTANALILFNQGGANRSGIGYVPNTGELRFNNQYFITFTTGATALGGTERLRIKSDGGILQTKTGGNANYTISRNESVGTTDQPIGVIDFASNTAHTTQARLMGKTRGTSNVGGDLVVETRADGGSLDERFRITGGGQVNIGSNFTQTTYPFSVQKDLNSGGNLAYFANSDSTYNQGLALSFDSNKDIEWSGGSGAGGMDWNMGTRGYKWRIVGSDRALLSQYGMFTLESGSQSGNSKPGIELKSTGYTGNITRLFQDSPNAISVLETTERSLLLDIDSGNQVAGSCLAVEIDGTEEFRFDPGHFEFKNNTNTSRGTLLGGINYYSNTNAYVDLTQWRLSDNWNHLEVFGYVNPNSSGSGQYTDPVHMYIYRGIGWANGGIKHFIYSVHVAPPARQAFQGGSGMSGNSGVSAVWCNSGSVVGNESATGSHYVRLVIPNANANANFQKSFRILRRF